MLRRLAASLAARPELQRGVGMIRLSHWTHLLAVASLIAALGCGGSDDEEPGRDSGPSMRTDGGVRLDAGTAPDSGTTPVQDAGIIDAGSVAPVDSGSISRPDAGPPTPTQPGAVGASCSSDPDCTQPAGGTCRTSLGSAPLGITLPGGYCTHECTAGAGAETCGEGATCFSLGFGPAFCARTCTSDNDCRQAEGYTCQASPIPTGASGMYCLPPIGIPGLGGDGGFGIPGIPGLGGDGGFGLPDFGGGLPGFGGDGGFGLPDFGGGGLPGFGGDGGLGLPGFP